MLLCAKNKKYKSIRGGFVILYAILLSTVVLTIGLSLLEVLVQQTALSGAERESLSSFSAADSGMECALYADTVQDAFRTGLLVTCNITPILCNNSPITVSAPTSVVINPLETAYTCNFQTNLPEGGCAMVSVEKITDTLTDALATTTIRAKGYNTNCPPAASTKPWRLERGLQTIY